jgi:malonyl-CoA O-methyltransferase
MSVQNQFSKYANEYGKYNIIQQIVSKALVRDIKTKPKKILELGCGSGQVISNINWKFDYYKATDFSNTMCKIHPKSNNLDIFCLDFDSDEFYNNIKDEQYDMVLSSSAMQWSKNLDLLVSRLSNVSKEINAVLFTSNTFKSIRNITNSASPILDINTIKKAFEKYCDCEFEVIKYDLEFNSKKEMFKYIKNSGVSGDSSLSYKDAKYLYKNYNLSYIEFEVIFIKAFSRL